MSWTYDPKTQRTDQPAGIVPRVLVEEAVARLHAAGSSKFEIVRVMSCLSGISPAEVSFTWDLVVSEKGVHVEITMQDLAMEIAGRPVIFPHVDREKAMAYLFDTLEMMDREWEPELSAA